MLHLKHASRRVHFKLDLLKDSRLSTLTQRRCICFSAFQLSVKPHQNGEKITSIIENDDHRVNPLNIQMLSRPLHRKLFPHKHRKPSPQQIVIAQKHLDAHGLWNKPTTTLKEIDLDLPRLHGCDLDAHFRQIAENAHGHTIKEAKSFANIRLLEAPKEWEVCKGGWTRYDPLTELFEDGLGPEDGETLVFDVEVLVQVGFYPVIAVAASRRYWYAWVSPCVFGEQYEELIPLGDSERIVVGHNVAFDRARIKEQYHLRLPRHHFIDTMALHSCVGGLCNQQRAIWTKYSKKREEMENADEDVVEVQDVPRDEEGVFIEKEDSAWFNASARNSLKEVARLYCNLTVDKSVRGVFVEGNIEDVKENLNLLLSYCAKDVEVTHQVYRALLPKFFDKCPHPVTFSGMLRMATSFLPTDESWKSYIESAEKTYLQLSAAIEAKLRDLGEEALALFEKNDPSIQSDPWLKNLDWHVEPLKMTAPKFKKDGKTYRKNGEPRPYKNQFMPGKPKWYKDAWDRDTNQISLTTRSRVAPYLFKLKWLGYPVYHSREFGWAFRVPFGDHEDTGGTFKTNQVPIIITTPEHDPIIYAETMKKEAVYYKIPHKDGDAANCGNPLSKGYTKAFENGVLTSEYGAVKEALEMNTICAYWISSRDRVKSQFPIWQDKTRGLDLGLPDDGYQKHGMILPQVCVMGTVTRRAVEPTWMTASNAKKNRIGSELKAQIKAPAGYAIVGADVDSEELWISSIIGDAQFGLHGGTAIGWMTLQGTKAAGTDLHSVTAKILGISRDHAKVFNYGRIYGAGEKFAVQLLLQFNPSLTPEEAQKKARELYKATKGAKWYRRAYLDRLPREFWYGGSESFVFNRLEEIAWSSSPKTPVLECGITDALAPKNTQSKVEKTHMSAIFNSLLTCLL
jgi:DNA polymerase gamma 1